MLMNRMLIEWNIHLLRGSKCRLTWAKIGNGHYAVISCLLVNIRSICNITVFCRILPAKLKYVVVETTPTAAVANKYFFQFAII